MATPIRPRRWPVYRSAAQVRADIALSFDATDTRSEEWLDAVESLTAAELDAHREASDLEWASRSPIRGEARSYGAAPVVVLDAHLATPGLPEPACVVAAALLEMGYPRTLGEIGARFGIDRALCTADRHPAFFAALDELARARLLRRYTDGRMELLAS